VTTTWQVLLSEPDGSFKPLDTGIRRPFPLGAPPLPPTLNSRGAAMHLLDADGDRMPDLVQCADHGATADAVPTESEWHIHLWKPAQGEQPAGFDPEGERIDALGGIPCDGPFLTTDINADSKIDVLVQPVVTGGDGTQIALTKYDALSRREDGSWEVMRTNLPVVGPSGRVVFADVNIDGLPDAVESGFQDHTLRTYINTGRGFAKTPVLSLGSAGLGNQDLYFRLATVLDYNGDGRQDVLMPVPGGTLPNQSNELPAWAILQAKAGNQAEATFTLVDPKIPFEAEINEAITLADPRAPRVGSVNGDGAPDVVLPLDGVFHVFENLAPDQDVLVSVSDGMNDHDSEDPAFVPNVEVSYGHLVDSSITSGVEANDPVLASALYLSRSDPTNGCAYPRRCAVGPRRVVSGYNVNDGSGGVRRFSVQYRDGRYDHRGPGFVGFGARIITDLDTLAGTAEFFDNTAYDEDLKVYPLAGQVTRQWHWSPGLPSQPKPEQIDISFLDIARAVVPTNDEKTYFTLPTQGRLRRVEGVYSPGGSSMSLEAYVRSVESAGGGAKVLRDTTAKVTDFDDFGNVLAEEIATAGVDLTLQIDRSFKHDLDRWVLGQLQSQKECSSAAKMSQCRTLTRTTTIYGEVETESMETDDGSAETKRKVTYTRGDFGNITGITAENGFGHVRSSTFTYEPEGIFPDSHINAENHTSILEFDARFGALSKRTDPNRLVAEWKFDGFGRLALEQRPDGTHTSITHSRTKDSGSFRVTKRTKTSGGADDAVEFDSLGRPVRWFWHGPSPQGPAGEPPRLMQQVEYDPWSGKVARRSVPVSEGTAESKMLFDEYQFDAVGREVRHTTPWKALVQTAYDGLLVKVTDPLKHVTTTELDPLGRPAAITDAAKGVTSYTWGPFGFLYSATDPGTLADPSGAVTITKRDALGRVRQLDDPDRGATIQVWNGWGELLSASDALGRVSTFEYDRLGRMESRVDKQNGVVAMTTTWTWDTAANGLGKLHKLTSSDGEKVFAYNARGQLERLTLRGDHLPHAGRSAPVRYHAGLRPVRARPQGA
jgi:YD repeat-containing protein